MVDNIPKPVQLPLFDPIQITLTKKYTALIDPIDGDLTSFKWHAAGAHTGYPYAARRVGVAAHRQNTIYLHRTILERILNRPLVKGEMVDHANGNTLDNRRSNIRLATRAQNNRNAKRKKNNVSGYKGVSHRVSRYKSKVWDAHIRINGKQRCLGHFDTPEEAYAAYCAAAKKYFGEFARAE